MVKKENELLKSMTSKGNHFNFDLKYLSAALAILT